MVLILIFAEVLGLYGVIVSIMMLTRSTLGVTQCPYWVSEWEMLGPVSENSGGRQEEPQRERERSGNRRD
jgi:hypothetical protein